jgi:predicted nucleotide-binding protein (sugar kinase/HSP70/actin superfamily)
MSDDLAGRTIYVPYMSDHVYVIAAAMRALGLDGEVLPQPDAETLSIGLDLCRGRECLPCFLATGDVLKQARRPGFDASRAAFLMPGSPGPCRFGQYHVLQRSLLNREGAGDVRIITPTPETHYEGFGENPTALRRLIWHAIVAADLLLKLRYEFRPYELEAGVVDDAYATSLRSLMTATESGRGSVIRDALREIAKRFAALPVQREPRKPVVAFVGEIYVMLNDHSNQDMIRQLEQLGLEVVTGTLFEWLLFADWTELDRNRLFSEWGKGARTIVQDAWQRMVLHRSGRIIRPLLREHEDPSMAQLFALARPHYDPLLGTEATLTIARALWAAGHGASGVVNVLPFACMPGLLVTGMAPALRAEMGHIPWLDIWYDAQERTNVRTRLEAFTHQVKQHAGYADERIPAGVS